MKKEKKKKKKKVGGIYTVFSELQKAKNVIIFDTFFFDFWDLFFLFSFFSGRRNFGSLEGLNQSQTIESQKSNQSIKSYEKEKQKIITHVKEKKKKKQI